MMFELVIATLLLSGAESQYSDYPFDYDPYDYNYGGQDYNPSDFNNIDDEYPFVVGWSITSEAGPNMTGLKRS